jgi:hypothetical protein
MTKTQLAVIEWLANGDTGASSETMAYWLAFGIKRPLIMRPHDIYDLNRCFKLLDIAPELHEKIPEMAKLSNKWADIAKNWDWLQCASYDDAKHYLNNLMFKDD